MSVVKIFGYFHSVDEKDFFVINPLFGKRGAGFYLEILPLDILFFIAKSSS
jgi:hypothetical protein